MIHKIDIEEMMILKYCNLVEEFNGKTTLKLIHIISEKFHSTFNDNIFTRELIENFFLLRQPKAYYQALERIQEKLRLLFHRINDFNIYFCKWYCNRQIYEQCSFRELLNARRSYELEFLDELRTILSYREQSRNRSYLKPDQKRCLLCWRTVLRAKNDASQYEERDINNRRRNVNLCFAHRHLECTDSLYISRQAIKKKMTKIMKEERLEKKIYDSIHDFTALIKRRIFFWLEVFLFSNLCDPKGLFPSVYRFLQMSQISYRNPTDIVRILETPNYDVDIITKRDSRFRELNDAEQEFLDLTIKDYGQSFYYNYIETLISAEAWLRASESLEKEKIKESEDDNEEEGKYSPFCHFCWRSFLVVHHKNFTLCYNHKDKVGKKIYKMVLIHKKFFVKYQRLIFRRLFFKFIESCNNIDTFPDFVYKELFISDGCLSELSRYLHGHFSGSFSKYDVVRMLETPCNSSDLDHDQELLLLNKIEYYSNNFYEYIKSLILAEVWLRFEHSKKIIDDLTIPFINKCISFNNYTVVQLIRNDQAKRLKNTYLKKFNALT